MVHEKGADLLSRWFGPEANVGGDIFRDYAQPLIDMIDVLSSTKDRTVSKVQ